jgi:hypothetical protein
MFWIILAFNIIITNSLRCFKWHQTWFEGDVTKIIVFSQFCITLI